MPRIISQEVLEILACPECDANVTTSETTLSCSNKECNLRYHIVNGIPVMWPKSDSKQETLTQRWKEAQAAEKQGAIYFSDENKRIGKIFNSKVTALFQSRVNPESYVLEVGCGAYGIISGLRYVRTKVGIDPLMLTYIDYFDVDDDCIYISGVAEHIPVRDGSIDICFCNNVLDHCSKPSQVIDQLYGKLRSGGLLVIGVYCFNPIWAIIYSLAAKLKIWSDVYHPHLYTQKSLDKLLRSAGFTIEAHHDLSKEGYVLTQSVLQPAIGAVKKISPIYSFGQKLFAKFPWARAIFLTHERYIIIECVKS